MWMSLARRSSALKMVVSTSLMTGAMSLSSAVSLSIESVSSGFSSSPTTSSVKPSVTSSSTRCDCSVFFSRSEICDSVATLTRSFLLQQDRQLVDQVQVARIGQRDLERAVLRLGAARSCSGTSGPPGSSGTGRGRSWPRAGRRTRSGSAPPGARLLLPRLAGSANASASRSCCHRYPPSRMDRVRQREDRQIQRDQHEGHEAPMKIMMAGSISDSAAACACSRRPRRNSATLLSIAGSAPVDSPTSIMSMASGGKMPVACSEDDSDCPSRTSLPALSSAFAAAACRAIRRPFPAPAPAGCRRSAACSARGRTAPPGT
jgi:hypothetical protein